MLSKMVRTRDRKPPQGRHLNSVESYVSGPNYFRRTDKFGEDIILNHGRAAELLQVEECQYGGFDLELWP